MATTKDSSAVSVSLHQAQGQNTQNHNDRSLWERERGEKGHDASRCLHWDWRMGREAGMICPDGRTHYVRDAEREFFEQNFRQDFERKNERIRKKRGKKYVRTEREYMEAHQPFEFIVQLGNVANIDTGVLKREHSRDYLVALRRSLVDAMRESYGFEVVSFDVHDDEETPHAHIRGHYMYEGEANRNKALNAHGFRAKGTKNTAKDNPSIPMTADLREKLEDAADIYLRSCGYRYSVDRERLPGRSSESVRDYKEIQEKVKEKRRELQAVESTLAAKRTAGKKLEEREKAITAREKELSAMKKQLKRSAETVKVQASAANAKMAEAVERESEAREQRNRYKQAADRLTKFVGFVKSLERYNNMPISPAFKALLVALVIEFEKQEKESSDDSRPEQQYTRRDIELSHRLENSLKQKSYSDEYPSL